VVIDTSALVAILFDEEDAESFEMAIERDPVRLISAASLLETAMVVESRYGEAGGRELDLLLAKASIETVSVTEEQVEHARRAFHRYGRGRGKAKLNFGDCFSYALAEVSGEPLLFKGRDFRRTDIPTAL